ncbi:MAG: HD domain-containing protein [Gammaproteobacteria bacterium]|jgi:HD-GYP domain-containing protein (c-di-GMP phosphodiesterase class II)
MNSHKYTLRELNRNIPVSQKLAFIHDLVKAHAPHIDRISVAVYDPKTDLLKTFIHSSGGADPLSHYQARLSEVASLQDIAASGEPRVVNDLEALYRASSEHSRKLSAGGYGSSYTLPMFFNDLLFGFVFFNSHTKDGFCAELLPTLDLYGQLISLTVINELSIIHTMLAAVRTARDMTSLRDVETGAHLDRMAHYARLIAKTLAPKYGFSDEYIEHLFLFAPLHDIGKIGIPDRILHKQGALDAQERETMRQHARSGRDVVDAMLNDFGLNSLPYVDVLRNITEFHHEKMDASGYPLGLKGSDIPIEARIIAVADIFDALTSRRPYKHAWSNEEAFTLLHTLADTKLDGDCIRALTKQARQVKKIQKQFHSDEWIPRTSEYDETSDL